MWFSLGSISRWLVFVAVLLLVGALVFVAAIARSRPEDGDRDSLIDPAVFLPRYLAARTGFAAGLLLLLAATGRLVAQLAVFRDPFEPLSAELRLLLDVTTWGRAWIAQIFLGLVATLLFLRAARGLTRGGRPTASWIGAAAATAGLALVPAFSGHALGTEELRTLAVAGDGLHVLAASTWLGTLALIAVVAAGSRRRGAPVERVTLIRWIARFSPIAMGSAGVVAASGVFASWLRLDAVSSLWLSPYGRLLLLKLAILGAVVGLGAYNWKRSRGRVELSGDPARLPRTVAWELVGAAAILLVTAVLVNTPMPGEGG